LFNGIINIYKEKGYTSHDVVAKLRGILKQKKIGHTGTLDPDAEGVLPVCLGNGTKLCDLLTDKDKTYEAVLLLGITTDTQDITGTVLSNREVLASRNEIEESILSYIGEYNQLPPMYSAIKVNGKKLYELAREGKEIEREKRKVWIHNIQILNIDEDKKEARILVDCSKGTYIRTLCHDIGEKLGCGGCMKSLVRTKVGAFTMENSLTLTTVQDMVQQETVTNHIINVEDMFPNYPRIIVKEDDSKLIYNGNTFHSKHVETRVGDLDLELSDSEPVRVYDWQNHFIGVYEYFKNDDLYKPLKMFL
jgi:tRNA pseudouridine55 synthase